MSSTDYPDFAKDISEECQELIRTTDFNNSHTKSVHDPTIRLLFASAATVENLVVIIALLVSWKALRQSIYIFALSIAAADCLLGLTHIVNSIVASHFSGKEMDLKVVVQGGMGTASWFYIIRSSTMMTAQVAATGNAAFLAIAFKKYVYALAPSRIPDDDAMGTNETTAKKTSTLLSRKTSYIMTACVWVVSIVLGGVVPLAWNCAEDCSCFLEADISRESKASIECFENHGCSYLFPPLKSVAAMLILLVYFVSLAILIGSYIQVLRASGGLYALLPYSLHKYYARKTRRSIDAIEATSVHRRLRQRSVQMNYMRDMMHFMLLITLTYFLCRLPAGILLLVESLTTERLNIPENWVLFIILLGYFDSILNPIIFATTLHGMKEAFKKLLNPCCTHTVSVSIGTQNRKGNVKFDDTTVDTRV